MPQCTCNAAGNVTLMLQMHLLKPVYELGDMEQGNDQAIQVAGVSFVYEPYSQWCLGLLHSPVSKNIRSLSYISTLDICG